MPDIIKNVVAKALKSSDLPPILRPRLLSRQREGNIQRLKKLTKVLEPQKYGIKFENESEVFKCLYPTKMSRLAVPNGANHSNRQLEMLGKEILLLTLNQTFLNLFKRTGRDISGFDFNFDLKMDHMSSWKKSPPELIRRFLKNKSLTHLARLPVPQDRIPDRVQCAFDLKAFNTIIGYISVTNDSDAVSHLLKDKIVHPVARTILLQ